MSAPAGLLFSLIDLINSLLIFILHLLNHIRAKRETIKIIFKILFQLFHLLKSINLLHSLLFI
ncbi:unnamed protein product [Meloidogyne enterolobii]|uniref:Uncharacterized protein n=1 Tax=Meloidogyne enterolobii TaxID=390850 RepID=A0ACB0ZUQ7_MELEN